MNYSEKNFEAQSRLFDEIQKNLSAKESDSLTHNSKKFVF
jgi:hypothetical protein